MIQKNKFDKIFNISASQLMCPIKRQIKYVRDDILGILEHLVTRITLMWIESGLMYMEFFFN